MLRKNPDGSFEEFRRDFFARLAIRENENVDTGYYHFREQPAAANDGFGWPRESETTPCFLTEIPKEHNFFKNNTTLETRLRSVEKHFVALRRRRRKQTRLEREVELRLRCVRDDPVKKRQLLVLLELRCKSSKFDAIVAYCQQNPTERMQRHFEIRRLRCEAAQIRRNAIIQAERQGNKAIGRKENARRKVQHREGLPDDIDAKYVGSWLTISALTCFSMSLRERHAKLRADSTRLTKSCQSIQSIWRRKTAAARGRAFRKDACRLAAWCGKRWRLKMRMRRIWALELLCKFLDDNRRFSTLRRVAKDLTKATRRLQTFLRDYNTCTAARLKALTQFWMKVEAEMVRDAETEIERRFEVRRKNIVALAGKTRIRHFDRWVMARFLEDLRVEQDEVKRTLKVHPVSRHRALTAYLGDRRLHYKITTASLDELLSGMKEKRRPILTIDDAKALLSGDKIGPGVVGRAGEQLDFFRKKRKNEATMVPDATFKIRLYSHITKACMQELIRSAKTLVIDEDTLLDQNPTIEIRRQRETVRCPSRPASSGRRTTRRSSKPASAGRNFCGNPAHRPSERTSAEARMAFTPISTLNFPR